MIDLLSKKGLAFLESVVYADALLAFDFDGTLAPIVAVPSKAKMTTATQSLLTDLIALGPTAIISGRSLQDLRERIQDHPNCYLVGNHGLEGIQSDTMSEKMFKELVDRWIAELNPLIQSEPGIEIENKEFSLAIHYRRSRNKKKARKKIAETINGLDPGGRIVLGKCVFNLVPPLAPHKGMALLDLMQSSKKHFAFYIGDDETDEDVFSLPNSSILGVRVGKKKSSNAKFYISRQTDINRVLKFLIQKISAHSPKSSGGKDGKPNELGIRP